MLRMTQTRADYDAAIAMYQKGLQMLRLAARAPR
jgi:hypothetical protein